MSHVLTLIAARGAHGLLADVADDLCAAIGASHPPVWLARTACDIPFRAASEAALAEAHAALASIPANAPIDSLIQPVEGRRKLMLVADMDSTIIQQECLDEVAKAAGIGPKIAAITDRAMRGELQFENALKERIGLLSGFREDKLRTVLDRHIELTPGARELTGTMRANGARAVLVSGGFTFFTERLQDRLGLDFAHANVLEVNHGKLTGRVVGGIVDAEQKMLTVERVCTQIGIDPEQSIVMGDGANDLKMMGIAGLSVAFRAKPVVRAQAGVALNFSGLDGLLAVLA